MSEGNTQDGVGRREFMKASAAATFGAAAAMKMVGAKAEAAATDIQRFMIEVPDAVLEDLRDRLARTRYPDQLEGTGWTYGTELSYLKELCAYWATEYDWRKQEEALNRFEHYRTDIDGLGIHFIHQRSKEEKAFPLVITHGWPGSFTEFTKIIEPLTDPVAHGGRAEDAFHVVCPSMPGYGFSDAPKEPGFDSKRVAETEAKLMARLGYEGYGAQGGDWGAIVSTQMAQVDPDHVKGIHLNMILAKPPEGTPAEMVQGLNPKEVQGLMYMQKWLKTETGYQRIQGTKPQSLGYGLNDSPAGLAAWIVEKFYTWGDCKGNVENSFTKDELLTNIMIYWVTQTITSSTRLYYEAGAAGPGGLSDERVEIPTGCAAFPAELTRFPRKWVEKSYNVTHWTDMPAGGHFAALEEPELLVADIRTFFGSVR